MRLVVDHLLDASPDSVFDVVADLDQYPAWMGIVHSSRGVGDGAWEVELRARIGPFARSKRLRMERIVTTPPHHVRFERRENDGRTHGEWILDVKIEQQGTRSRVEMVLSYSGRLWSSVVEKVLHDEIEASKSRLAELVAG